MFVLFPVLEPSSSLSIVIPSGGVFVLIRTDPEQDSGWQGLGRSDVTTGETPWSYQNIRILQVSLCGPDRGLLLVTMTLWWDI